jgi:hypothetical protein
MAMTALASRADAQATNNDWQFELTPYGWVAGVSGTVGSDNAGGPGLGIEQTWSDVFAKIEFALMGSFEARKGRWGAMTDGVRFRIRAGGTLAGTHGFTSLSASGTLAQELYSAAATFRAKQGRSPIDLMSGLRYSSIGWDVDIAVAQPPVGEPIEDTRTWLDPYVGARIEQALGDRWSLRGYADIGGFGVGSKQSMQALAEARFAITSWVSGTLGYRAVSADYDKDGSRFDMVNAGTVLGVSFRW